MVESQPSKLLVAGSIPVSRSMIWKRAERANLQSRKEREIERAVRLDPSATKSWSPQDDKNDV